MPDNGKYLQRGVNVVDKLKVKWINGLSVIALLIGLGVAYKASASGSTVSEINNNGVKVNTCIPSPIPPDANRIKSEGSSTPEHQVFAPIVLRDHPCATGTPDMSHPTSTPTSTPTGSPSPIAPN